MACQSVRLALPAPSKHQFAAEERSGSARVVCRPVFANNRLELFSSRASCRHLEYTKKVRCQLPFLRHPILRVGIVLSLADASSATGSGKFGKKPIITRRERLLEYVKNVQPDIMDRFVQKAPDQVVEAMRQTVSNMLGTLPSQFFEVSVTTVGENLAQLMYSVMMTGYMFRNAQYRLDLSQSMVAALPDPDRPRIGDPHYEEGVQKSRVSGEVLRWHKKDGPVAMDAVKYIELLESELEELQRQLETSRHSSYGRNQLLEYLKVLQPQNLQELTSSAGDDALEAMNSFIQRLLGVTDAAELKAAGSETTAAELAKLLYWLMVVGYSIRNIEVRHDMERALGSTAQLAELPAAEYDLD